MTALLETALLQQFRCIEEMRHANGRPAEDRQADTECARGPLDFELLDFYAAIFVVVPLALFLTSLWS